MWWSAVLGLVVNPEDRCFLKTWLICSFAHIVKPVLNSHSKEEKERIFKTDNHLMLVKSIAECCGGAFCITLDIPQYLRPALSYHLSLRPSFYLFLSGGLRQVWL